MMPAAAFQLTSVSSSAFEYVEVLVALGAVLVLAYLTLRVGLPRILGMRSSAIGPIKVVARYPLEPKKTLYLVKAGSQILLIGTSENQVQYLTALAPENAAEVLASAPREEPQRREFRELLGWFQKGGGS